MAKSAAITGDIVHTVGVRYRVRGSGQFRTRLYNMGTPGDTHAPQRFANLDNMTLTSGSAREKTAIANFQDQGIQIYFRTIFFEETFNLSKIVLFVKPVAESYPILSGG